MGFLDFFRRRPETPAEPGTDTPPAHAEDVEGQFEEDLMEAARDAVLPGFCSRDEATERVREALELDAEDPRPGVAVSRVWDARLAEERGWEPGSSDYERVERAFSALAELGLIARMNFACCNSCGTTEIGDERTELPEKTSGYRFREEQYVFFHEQDADRLAEEPAHLLLSFGAWRASRNTAPELMAAARSGDKDAEKRIREQTDREVGGRVVAALRAEGLDVDWNGDTESRISVEIAHWRKPLPR